MLSIRVFDNEHILNHKRVQEKCAILAADVPLNCIGYQWRFWNYFM